MYRMTLTQTLSAVTSCVKASNPFTSVLEDDPLTCERRLPLGLTVMNCRQRLTYMFVEQP